MQDEQVGDAFVLGEGQAERRLLGAGLSVAVDAVVAVDAIVAIMAVDAVDTIDAIHVAVYTIHSIGNVVS